MELRDLIVTPLLLLVVMIGAYFIRPHLTDSLTRRYFFPALIVRMFGALCVGILYQFYYKGGDTFIFHTYGSRIIWEAFMDSPSKGIQLFLSPLETKDVYAYSTKLLFARDPSSFAIVRIAAVFDLITWSSYSATAVLFSLISFLGAWLLFQTFYDIAPNLHKLIALSTLFIPSVVFWGSGLLKDTVTLASVGICTFMVFKIFIKRDFRFLDLLVLVFGFYLLYVIKIYILLTFLPAVIIWIFLSNLALIRSVVLKILLIPPVVTMAAILGYFSVEKATEENPKYSLDALAKTAQVTAYDIRFWTGRDAGSGYTLGELDGTWNTMLSLGPQAINVSLFRPYLWEVRNPLMLLSSLESTIFFFLTLWVLFQAWGHLWRRLMDPKVIFCLLFSLSFAFAVGVSTFNFGTLTRYKIPLMPFYAIALVIVGFKGERKTLMV